MEINRLAFRIFLGLLLGIFTGLFIRLDYLPLTIRRFLVYDCFSIGGIIFVNMMKMLVVPVVFVSLVCGISNLKDNRQLGRLGLKTFGLYLGTTALAIMIALLVAHIFHIGYLPEAVGDLKTIQLSKAPSFRDVLVNLFPTNPIQSLSNGEMLQVIVFSILLGISVTQVGKASESMICFFNSANAVIMQLINMMMWFAPYGVFFLLAKLFATQGLGVINQLVSYFITVLGVLCLHMILVYSLLLRGLAGLNPFPFFKKMYPAMLFAFSTSSSNASIPVVMQTVEKSLGVDKTIASFVVTLGATINMDGTSIMQGVATVFIANAYHIAIGFSGYVMIVLMSTLASVGTAGVPGVGLVTLTMVLQQVGIPVEGIAMILGVDRLLDMMRTAVNITGDAMVSCIVAKSEGALNSVDNKSCYDKKHRAS